MRTHKPSTLCDQNDDEEEDDHHQNGDEEEEDAHHINDDKEWEKNDNVSKLTPLVITYGRGRGG